MLKSSSAVRLYRAPKDFEHWLEGTPKVMRRQQAKTVCSVYASIFSTEGMEERTLCGSLRLLDSRVELPATQEKSGQMTKFGAESSNLRRSAFDQYSHRTKKLVQLTKSLIHIGDSLRKLLHATCTKTLIIEPSRAVVSGGLSRQDVMSKNCWTCKNKRTIFGRHGKRDCIATIPRQFIKYMRHTLDTPFNG